MRLLFLLATVAVAHAQSGIDPGAVLDRARAKLRVAAHSLEKYVCIETIDRNYYQRIVPRAPQQQSESLKSAADPECSAASSQAEASGRRPQSTDRVRFEVTLSQGHELHSWPGARGFDVRDVDELVRNGPLSTGAFGAYLLGIFDRPGVQFDYRGERSANGKTLFEYRYHVPVAASHLEIKVAEGWRPSAYEGEFQIDPQTLELARLTIRTTDLPPGAGFCSAAVALDYQRVHVGDSDILLPRQGQLEVTMGDGRETTNVVAFANCREYQAESEMVFDTLSEPPDAVAESPGRGRVRLPIGLPVTLALTGSIDTGVAAAGDPVSAKVVKAVRRPGSAEELIPAGAVVEGRIRRVEHHLFPQPYFVIAMAFNRVEIHGVFAAFAARSEPDSRLAKDLGARLDIPASGIWFWDIGTFLFPTSKSRLSIPAGFETKWFTLANGR